MNPRVKRPRRIGPSSTHRVPPVRRLGLDVGPDLQCTEVVPVLLESGLLERKDNFLSVIKVSVARTDNVGENDEAAAWHLGGVNDAPALFPTKPADGPRNAVLVLGHSTNLLEYRYSPQCAGPERGRAARLERPVLGQVVP